MDKPKTITGRVVRYSRESLGSFRNVVLEGQADFITIGIGDGLAYPKVGDTITVNGVEKEDGRFLTGSWEFTNGS